jgi:antitoxin VapB
MPLSIKHPDADFLARDLARRQGKSLTDAIIDALRAELAREKKRVRSPGLASGLMEIGAHFSSLQVLDSRSPDDIIGYDEHGIPR